MSYSGWERYSRTPLQLRAAVALAITLVFLIVPALGDQWAYAQLYIVKVYDHDWAMALRAAGTLYVWIPVTLIIWLVQSARKTRCARRRTRICLCSVPWPRPAGLL